MEIAYVFSGKAKDFNPKKWKKIEPISEPPETDPMKMTSTFNIYFNKRISKVKKGYENEKY